VVFDAVTSLVINPARAVHDGACVLLYDGKEIKTRPAAWSPFGNGPSPADQAGSVPRLGPGPFP